MAFFPGQWNQAGGTWVDPSRVQTSSSGGAYIGGMTPQLPTQDMSFMWGGNTPSAAPASTKTDQWNTLMSGIGMTPSSPIGPVGAPIGPTGGVDPFSNPINPNAQFDPTAANSQSWMQTLGLGGSTPASTPAAQPGITSTPYAGGSYGGGSDPYLSGRADDITRRTQEMLGDSFAGIAGNAVGSGSLGGTRQGVAQGIAAGRAADYMAGRLADMYSGDWNQSQNRGLQKYGMDQSYRLTDQGQQLGFFNTQRGLDQSQYELALQALGLSQSGAWAPVTSMTGAVAPYTGNGTTVNTGSSGGGAMGLLGGTLGTAQLLNNLGLFK